MARLRTRLKRTVYLLGALLLLLLLFELNRWLPGTWHGGGDGGFRTAGELGLPDPTRLRTDPPPRDVPQRDPPEDPATVEAPTEVPKDWPPRAGVVVQIRGPKGQVGAAWRLGGAGGGTALLTPQDLAAGRLDLTNGAQGLRHRNGFTVPASHYVVHVPAGTLPRAQAPAPVAVQVRDPVSGDPVAAADITWLVDGAEQHTRTDPQGRARVPGPADGEPFPITITREGRMPRTGIWLRPRQAGVVTIRQPVAVETRARFRWSDGRPATIGRGSVRGLDGELLAKIGGGLGRPSAEVRFTLPADQVESATLTLEPLRTDIDGLRVSLPVKDLTEQTTLPEPRTVRLVVRNVQGEPVPDAEVLVRLDRGEAEGAQALRPWTTRTNVHGAAQVSLAPGQGCEIVVQRGSLGPEARRLHAVDGSDTLDFVLQEGVFIPVRVTNEAGVGLIHRLHARGTSRGVRVEAGSRLDLGSRARIGPLPAGPTELYAQGLRGGAVASASTGTGSAWQATVVDAQPAMGTVKLAFERGYPLTLVVADAFGAPLAGASIELAVTAGGAPHVMPPDSPAWLTNAQGHIALRDLPNRVYEVRVSLPGYGTQRLRGIRPGGALHFVTLVRGK